MNKIKLLENVCKLLKDNKKYKDLCILYLKSGMDNANFKIGENYLLRVPLHNDSAKLIENEIKYLGILQNKLPISIPKPIDIIKSEKLLKFKSVVYPYYIGNTADKEQCSESSIFKLAKFLKELHSQSFNELPINQYRGVPLSYKENDVNNRIAYFRKTNKLINSSILKLWNNALDAKLCQTKCVIHGDLHLKNIIVLNTNIEAIIDWGDINWGDPATDLSVLWMITKNNILRDKTLNCYGASSELIKRSVGWAVFFATVFLEIGESQRDVEYTHIGNMILENLNAYANTL